MNADGKMLIGERMIVKLDPNPATGIGIIEYVATFPNVTVNAGEQYQPMCIASQNSGTHMYNRKYFTCG